MKVYSQTEPWLTSNSASTKKHYSTVNKHYTSMINLPKRIFAHTLATLLKVIYNKHVIVSKRR